MEIKENDNEEDNIKDVLKKKERLVSFSKINKYYLFPPILLTLYVSFSNNIIKDNNKDDQKTK